jgi:class 3 adenylate cyclase
VSAARATPRPPRGVVTFLFSDIEGSTRLLQQDRDGTRAGHPAPPRRLCGA